MLDLKESLFSAMETPDQARRIRFGPHEVDLRSRELRKHRTRMRLQDQPFQVLAMLLERPGELVTREELRSKLWPQNTFVDFDVGLNTAIRRLRNALNDKAGKPRYIETLPRRGYRFIATLDYVAPDSLQSGPVIRTSPSLLETGSYHVSSKERLSLQKLWTGAIAVAGLVAILLVLNAGGFRQSLIRWPATPGIRSIAVLPLENLTGDPGEEDFADGMTDALITNLAKVKSLRVISRTSAMHYKKAHLPLAEIAHELKVDGVVEGTVVRSGNRVRITAQLIEVANDRHLWAESFEGGLQDLLRLQDEVSRAIVEQVLAEVTR
jgi:TolB-like protein/DNA-binding winged helix-turn-helix (wHTH) protein